TATRIEFSSFRRTDEQGLREIASGDGTKRGGAGQDRQNCSVHLIVCALWVSRIARHQFRHSGIWQRVFKNSSGAGILREPFEQSANGFLHTRDNCERCAAAWVEDQASL